MTLRLQNVEIPVQEDANEQTLRREVAKLLGLKEEEVRAIDILKKSLDARRKARIVYHYQIDVDVLDEVGVLNSVDSVVAQKAEPRARANPIEGLNLNSFPHKTMPIVIGTGPAGIFAALTMASAGQPCILVERGEAVEKRMRTVNSLRRDGTFTAESNYCFGEGGAGTFSDGKLTCGKNHPLIRHVFELFVKYGAPAEILYDAKPHIGTDFLMQIAKRMRSDLVKMGCVFEFGKRWVDFSFDESAKRYTVKFQDGTSMETHHLVVAIGHSARDTYQMLLDRGVSIVPKPFAIGARFEHPQEQINSIQFGNCDVLPAAEYKLATQSNNRGIWTFCMCPGGHLLPTSAQPDRLAINGMSYHSRKSGFANAAVVVNVLREDFYKGHPLDGMRFQEELEMNAFKVGGGNYFSPAQRLKDFVSGRESKGELQSTYKPGVTSARMDRILPHFVVDALKAAVLDYNKTMRGFLSEEAVVVGLESKTSSPISMMRDKNLQSVSHPNFFPAGEGAGFAGGIVSAALDGVRIGRAVLDSIVL